MVSRHMSNDGHCHPELGGGGNFTLENVRKDADNAEQKVQWFLKVHKTNNLL